MKPLNKIFNSLLFILFISLQLEAETYWTSERIFDLCESYSDIITFDSSGTLNVFWRKTKYEDAFPPSSHTHMKFHRGYLYYSQFDAEGNHIVTTEVAKAKALAFTIRPISINTYLNGKLILSWADNKGRDDEINHLGVFNRSGQPVSKFFRTASKNTRISYNSSGNIFVIRDTSHGLHFLIYQGILNNKLSVRRRIGAGTKTGDASYIFDLNDFSITSLDSNSVLIGIRIESYKKEALKKVSTTKDRFILLRVNAEGERINEPEIIDLKESAYSIIEGALQIPCEFLRLKDGSIILIAGSMDQENTIYQVRFTKDGNLVKTDTPERGDAKAFHSIENLSYIHVRRYMFPLKSREFRIETTIYGFDKDGNMYYAKQEKEKSYK